MTLDLRPRLRGVSHQFAFFLALGAGAVLTATARSPRATVVAAIYAATLAAMLGISATYHRVAWGPRARAVWRRLDHATIFLFIAGSYTPVAALALRGGSGGRLLALVWLGAGLGVLRAVLWPRAPRAVAAALYLLLGWTIVAYWPEVRAALAPGSHAFLIAGGALYSLGAIVYALRRPDPSPRVFGYHEVFHALVIAGCACHFIAVFELIQRA